MGISVMGVANVFAQAMDEDTDEIYYTNVACSWLNSKTCSCKDYPNRFTSGEGAKANAKILMILRGCHTLVHTACWLKTNHYQSGTH